MILESASLKIRVPRAWRFIFWDRLRRLCCLNANEPRTLPAAVVLKRFLALDLVFILGIGWSFGFVFSASLWPDSGF